MVQSHFVPPWHWSPRQSMSADMYAVRLLPTLPCPHFIPAEWNFSLNGGARVLSGYGDPRTTELDSFQTEELLLWI